MKDNSGKQNAKFLGALNDVQALHSKEKTLLVRALKDIVLMARTSGGVAGPDKGLIEACDRAESLLLQIGEKAPAYFIATENGIADIDTPPSDN